MRRELRLRVTKEAAVDHRTVAESFETDHSKDSVRLSGASLQHPAPGTALLLNKSIVL